MEKTASCCTHSNSNEQKLPKQENTKEDIEKEQITQKPSFYRRPMPKDLIAFSSREGQQIFKEALSAGGMECFFALIEQFHTQQEPAYCGLATLAMTLNALQLDPNRLWKGPWRWYSEELLDCCVPLEDVKRDGINMAEFCCLAKCNGADCTVHYADDFTEDEFRDAIISATENFDTDDPKFLIVSYNRGTLGQTGTGHFSPIGGYHKKRDLVLILDVARFKYPPYYVPLSLLYQSLLPVDNSTGKSRGYVFIEKAKYRASLSLFCKINSSEGSWLSVVGKFKKNLKNYLQDLEKKEITVQDIIDKFYLALDMDHFHLISPYILQNGKHQGPESKEAEIVSWTTLTPQHKQALQKLFEQATSTNVFKAFEKAQTNNTQSDGVHTVCKEKLVLYTIFFLSIPLPKYIKNQPSSVVGELKQLKTSVEVQLNKFPELKQEIQFIESQLLALDEFCQCKKDPKGISPCCSGKCVKGNI